MKGKLILLLTLLIPSVVFAKDYYNRDCSFYINAQGEKVDSMILNPPYGLVKWDYINEGYKNKGYVYAITPQNHPGILPNTLQTAQFEVFPHFEYQAVLTDSEHNEIKNFTLEPYGCTNNSMWQRCYSWPKTFNAPSEPGNYYFDIYDNESVLLNTASFEVLSSQIPLSELDQEKTVVCTFQKMDYDEASGTSIIEEGYFTDEYNVTLSIPYPIIVEEGHPDHFSVTISSNDLRIEEVVQRLDITMQIPTGSYAEAVIEKAGDYDCSANSCTQNFSLMSTNSVRGLAMPMFYVDEDSKTNLGGGLGVTVLNKGKIKEIITKLNGLHNTALNYQSMYDQRGEGIKADSWELVSEKVNEMIQEINGLITSIEGNELVVQDVVDLISIVQQSKTSIEEIINIIEGVES